MSSTRTPASGASTRWGWPARPTIGAWARRVPPLASIEIVVVLAVLALVLVGVLIYGVLRGRQQLLAFAATDGVLVAAATLDDPSTVVDERVEAARAAIEETLSPLERACDPIGSADGFSCAISVVTCSNEPGLSCISVELAHDNRTHPIVPLVAPLADLAPASLTAGAVAVVSGGL
ncbi:MAG: hypothetical protein ACK5RL_14825 [Acidimicrobiales bacterium]